MTSPALGTVHGIIADAMEDAGLLMEGQSPNSEQLAKHSRRLLNMINLWQTQGVKLWLVSDQAITLVSGQRAYNLYPTGDVNMVKPLRVLQGYYLYTATGVRRPVTVISYNEWLLLPSVVTTGAVTQYFVDKQQTKLVVNTWLTPDSNEASLGTLHVLLQTQVTQFTNLTDTVAFPVEWALALEWGLSAEICTGQPQAIVQRCMTNAQSYRAALEDWDVEDAPSQLQADVRINQGVVGNFI